MNQVTDIPDLPIVPLPGSEGWTDAYDWGNALEARFPGQDADQFAYACECNDNGPLTTHAITDLVMEQQGERDVAEWRWRVTLDSGAVWVVEGGCDYTGWDCQSHLTWTQA